MAAVNELEWEEIVRQEYMNKFELFRHGTHDLEEIRFRAQELRELARGGVPPFCHQPAQGKLLAETLEGTLIEMDEHFVTIEFDKGSRQELRRIPRTEFRTCQLRIQDAVLLRSELFLVSPTPPLSDKQAEEWERRHAELEITQAKTKRAKSVLEDEQ